MSSFVASLLPEVTGMLLLTPLSRLVRLAAEFAATVDVNVSDSTPTKLPKSVGDGLASSGSGDAATTQHQLSLILLSNSQYKLTDVPFMDSYPSHYKLNPM